MRLTTLSRDCGIIWQRCTIPGSGPQRMITAVSGKSNFLIWKLWRKGSGSVLGMGKSTEIQGYIIVMRIGAYEMDT